MTTWHKGLPDKPGIYWLHGYFFGDRCKRTKLLTVMNNNNRLSYHLDNVYIYDDEATDCYWTECVMPKFKEP